MQVSLQSNSHLFQDRLVSQDPPVWQTKKLPSVLLYRCNGLLFSDKMDYTGLPAGQEVQKHLVCHPDRDVHLTQMIPCLPDHIEV